MRSRLPWLVFAVPPLVALACGDTVVFNQVFAADGGAGVDSTVEAPVPDAAGDTSPPSPCDAQQGLACKVASCGPGAKTRLRGKVYDPSGTNPLYGVTVYIPSGPSPEVLPPIKDSTKEVGGITCTPCASVANPLRIATTDSMGEFTLDDVPVDTGVPIVVQIGKWRRLVHIDIANKCTDNVVVDKNIRLPRNAAEGNMPQIAVTSGFTALECFVRGLGIDDNEFVAGHDSSGHIHIFQGQGGSLGTPAVDLWNDAAQLRKYDALLLSCEGSELLENKGGTDAGARGAVYEYLNSGGRVLGEHFQYVWFKESPVEEFRQVATWGQGGFAAEYNVNTNSTGGLRFAEWLRMTGASTILGKVSIQNTTSSVTAVSASALSWIQTPATAIPKVFSFNTPISSVPANQCGRAMFLDFHTTDNPVSPASIAACGNTPGIMNASEIVLEFLFFSMFGC